MVYILALGAACSNALISVLQRMGVEDAKAEDTLKLSLLTHALRQGVWLAGLAFMIGSFLLQALALHFGRLSQVQPILVTELLFLVFILSTWFGFKSGLREWLSVGMASAGLAGFLVFASPVGGNRLPGDLGWVVIGGSCVTGMVVTVLLALRGPRWWRAAMFGTSAAIGYAFTAALIKVITHYAAQDFWTIFLHWETYGLVVFGILSLFLTQNAFHAGPIGASQAALVLVDPLVSIGIGIALFGDNVQTAGVRGPLEAFSLLLLIVGGFSLSHSSAVALVLGEGASSDLLTPRFHTRQAPAPPATTDRHRRGASRCLRPSDRRRRPADRTTGSAGTSAGRPIGLGTEQGPMHHGGERVEGCLDHRPAHQLAHVVETVEHGQDGHTGHLGIEVSAGLGRSDPGRHGFAQGGDHPPHLVAHPLVHGGQVGPGSEQRRVAQPQ
jgi:hypothetical protein